MKKFISSILAIILFTPLGLLAHSTAWGEWNILEIKQQIGFVPAGMQHFSGLVKIIFPNYGIIGLDKNFSELAIGYIFSALIGITAISLIFWCVTKLVAKQTNEKLR